MVFERHRDRACGDPEAKQDASLTAGNPDVLPLEEWQGKRVQSVIRETNHGRAFQELRHGILRVAGPITGGTDVVSGYDLSKIAHVGSTRRRFERERLHYLYA